jgi:adenosylhomocysteine nucleosidase
MRRFLSAACALLALCLTSMAEAADLLDATPRTAVITAFPPELPELLAAVQDKKAHEAVGVTFYTGTLEGKPIVLFMSGVSMVNAAMTTQVLLDRFNITRIVFSGAAGGVDPSLDVGDVVAPDAWGQYQESQFVRETAPGVFDTPSFGSPDTPTGHYGMIYAQSVSVVQGSKVERKFWFAVDPAMMAVLKAMPPVKLNRCVDNLCLVKEPKVVIGGHGVSGPTFVDNAAYRQWAYRTFDAQVLDMETAAVAQVAYANGKLPFIGFRSLSDLAGGGEGPNQADAFYHLAGANSAVVVRAFVKALP